MKTNSQVSVGGAPQIDVADFIDQQPVGSFQLMQGKIADMYVALNSARAYVYAVARACDAGKTTRFDTAGAILLASENAVKSSLEAIQEHCREAIAGYKVPRRLHVVDTVERSPSGKPDYQWAATIVNAGAEASTLP